MYLIDTNALINLSKNSFDSKWILTESSSIFYSMISAKELLRLDDSGRFLNSYVKHMRNKVPSNIKIFNDQQLLRLLSSNHRNYHVRYVEKFFKKRKPKAYKNTINEIQILRHFTCLPFSTHINDLVVDFKTQPRIIKLLKQDPKLENDLKIGMTALQHQLTLVTDNIKDFEVKLKIPGLTVEKPNNIAPWYNQMYRRLQQTLSEATSIEQEQKRKLDEIEILRELGLSDSEIIRNVWDVKSGVELKSARQEYKRLTETDNI